MSSLTAEVQTHWLALSSLLTIQSEADYDRSLKILNQLLDEVGMDEKHPLYGLIDTIGTLLHSYEEQHHPIPDCTGAEVLQFLMEEQGLTPIDLADIGSPDTIESILSGQSHLTVSQIRQLSQYFQVSPAIFI
ncbi:MAG: helix-turn-helix domain-containing protein [Prochlorothrix sp.]